MTGHETNYKAFYFNKLHNICVMSTSTTDLIFNFNFNWWELSMAADYFSLRVKNFWCTSLLSAHVAGFYLHYLWRGRRGYQRLLPQMWRWRPDKSEKEYQSKDTCWCEQWQHTPCSWRRGCRPQRVCLVYAPKVETPINTLIQYLWLLNVFKVFWLSGFYFGHLV